MLSSRRSVQTAVSYTHLDVYKRQVENDGLASHGGFKDWFLSEFERPGFTFEIGRGENPLPLSSFERIYEKLEETLLLAALM